MEVFGICTFKSAAHSEMGGALNSASSGKFRLFGLALISAVVTGCLCTDWLRNSGTAFFEKSGSHSLSINWFLTFKAQLLVAFGLASLFIAFLWVARSHRTPQEHFGALNGFPASRGDWIPWAALFLLTLSRYLWTTKDSNIPIGAFLSGNDHITDPQVLWFGLVVAASVRALAPLSTNERVTMLFAPVVVISAAFFCSPHLGPQFSYDGHIRIAGIWVNPNRFALLSAYAVIISASLLLWMHSTVYAKQLWNIHLTLPVAVCLGVSLWGLVLSYSRGTWIACCFAIIWLFWPKAPAWLRRNIVPTSVLASCSLLFAVYLFNAVPITLFKRLASITDVWDVSINNRVSVFMYCVRAGFSSPFVGCGWASPLVTLGQFSSDGNTAPLQAIYTNDPIYLASTSGLLAVAAYFATILFALRYRASTVLGEGAQAAVILFAIAFTLDGGLFQIGCCCLFWLCIAVSGSADHCGVLQEEGRVGVRETSNVFLKSAAWFCGTITLAIILFMADVLFSRANDFKFAVARHIYGDNRKKRAFTFLQKRPLSANETAWSLIDYINVSFYRRPDYAKQWDDELFEKYILDPLIARDTTGECKWRPVLWKYFYPEIRDFVTAADAVNQVSVLLKSRMSIVPVAEDRDILRNWQLKQCSAAQFEVLLVAALRSVDVPARLDDNRRAEFFGGGVWRSADI